MAPRSVCSDQRVDVDVPQEVIEVDPGQQPVQVDPVQHRLMSTWSSTRVQVDLVQQRVDIQRGHHQLDRTVRDRLGQRLPARDHPAIGQPLPLKRIHKVSITAPGTLRTTPQG